MSTAGSDEVGPQDREGALALLRRHWEARTLEPGDHEARTARVRSARTRADLDTALAGLPRLGGASGPILTGPASREAERPAGQGESSAPVVEVIAGRSRPVPDAMRGR